MPDEHSAVQISFDETVREPARRAVSHWFERTLPERVQFLNAPRGRSFADPALLVGSVSAIVNVIMLLIVLKSESSGQRQAWDMDRITALARSALARENVVNMDFEEIAGYAAFEDKQSDVFAITAIDRDSGSRYKIYITRLGGAYTIAIS